MTDPVYDPIAAFAGALASLGVRDVVVSPGSRSTPLAITFHAHPDLRTHVQLDERAAGFFALGQARATGRPSVLVCTSGTAAANYFPAVVEANHAAVPMIVCTADRPPELRDWGAGQTIDQVAMFGTNVRWAADLPVPSAWTEQAARLAATRAHSLATGPQRGPVHLNWPLRKPLEPVGAVPVRHEAPVDVSSPDLALPSLADDVRALLHGNGVVVIGPDTANGTEAQTAVGNAALAFGEAMGWPVIGEPLSQARRGASVASAEQLLAHPAATELRPDVVVRVGGAVTTASLNRWLEQVRPSRVLLVDPEQRWHDATFSTTHHLPASPLDVLALRGTPSPPEWSARWRSLEHTAATAIDRALARADLSSASVVRTLCAALPRESVVMTSNSMPPRDLDSFVPAHTALTFVGNRGAAGIDGITSTAAGVATQVDRPVVLFTGDLALLHDIGGLLGVARAGVHLTVVCIENDGGQIFSMLPIHGRIDEATYDTIFRTPHGLDFETLDGVGGVSVQVVGADDDLGAMLAAAVAVDEPGVDLLVIPIDPDHDMAVRQAVRVAVGEALVG